jgi:hypothetical protein
MVQQFSKPLAARTIEARDRAATKRVRVTVIEPGNAYSTLSQTEPGVVYTISRSRAGWQCECKGWQYTGCCKHIAAVQRRAEREGWRFGAVAPLPSQVSDETRAKARAMLTGRS